MNNMNEHNDEGRRAVKGRHPVQRAAGREAPAALQAIGLHGIERERERETERSIYLPISIIYLYTHI